MVRHADLHADTRGAILHAVVPSTAELLPYQLENMGMPAASIELPLYDVRVMEKGFTVSLHILGKPVKEEIVANVLASLRDVVKEGSEPVGWGALIDTIGFVGAVLQLLYTLTGDDWLPCAGVPVDAALAAVLAQKAESPWPTGVFKGRDNVQVVAAEEAFPAAEAATITGAACFDGYETRVVRTTRCDRLIHMGESDIVSLDNVDRKHELQPEPDQPEPEPESLTVETGAGVQCSWCSSWKDESLRRLLARESAPVTIEAATDASSNISFNRLSLETLLLRSRSIAAALKRSRSRMRTEVRTLPYLCLSGSLPANAFFHSCLLHS